MESWVLQEFETIHLGDKRLNNRSKVILSQLSKEPLSSIPSACKGWQETKAAYRYLDNEKVKSESILAPHKEATLKRVAENKRVFVLQDTTLLDYSSQLHKQGVGPTYRGKEHALLLHPSLVVNEAGVCMGVYDDYQWHREILLSRTATAQTLDNERLHKKPISEKESYRWVLGYRQANEIAQKCQDTQVIMIGDRGGDVYDVYEEAQKQTGKKAEWLIRLKITNRALIDNLGQRDTQLLHEKMQAIAPQQWIEFNLPKRNGDRGRKVQQALRLAQLTLHPPTGRRGHLRCNPVTVTVLLASEMNVPTGETPQVWWLMTSLPPEAIEQPLQLISWYLLRWQIEVFFRILKRGCQVENLQLMTAKRTRACLALYLIIAWRILFLTSLHKTGNPISCVNILEEEEWKTAWMIIKKKKPPQKPILLKDAIVLIAQMGGYLARKSDSPPGPKALWQGLTQLYHILNAQEMLIKLKSYG